MGLVGYWEQGSNTNPCSNTATGISITPMEKYVAENAKLDVVDAMPLMSILLVDTWVPDTGEMLVVSVPS